MYESGFLDDRITLLNRSSEQDTEFGRVGGDYEDVVDVWANWSPVKGKRVVNEGALDVLGTVVVRMRYHSAVNDDTRVMHEGVQFQQIVPPIISKKADEIQLTVQQIVK